MSEKRELTINEENYTCTGYNYNIAESEFTLHYGTEKGKKSLIPFKISYTEHRLREGTKAALEVVSNGFVLKVGSKSYVVGHDGTRSAGNYQLDKLLKESLWEEVLVEKAYDGELKERIENNFDVDAATFKLNTIYAAK